MENGPLRTPGRRGALAFRALALGTLGIASATLVAFLNLRRATIWSGERWQAWSDFRRVSAPVAGLVVFCLSAVLVFACRGPVVTRSRAVACAAGAVGLGAVAGLVIAVWETFEIW